MKIRNQFLILTLGVTVIPVLVLAFSWLIHEYRNADLVRLPDYAALQKSSQGRLDKADWEALTEAVKHYPGTFSIAAFDPSGAVLYSNDLHFRSGEQSSQAAILQTIMQSDVRYFYQIERHRTANNKELLILISIDRVVDHPPNPLSGMIEIGFPILSALLLFSSFMCLIIARAITHSVTILEKATRDVASGQLEQPIKVTGSNEITSLSTTLDHLRLALKEERAKRSRMVMGISHDLWTPLTLIKGYLEAIADEVSPEDQAKYLAIINAKADQLEGMIEDLISFSIVDTGEWRLQLKPRELRKFLGNFGRRISEDAQLLKRKVVVDIRIAVPCYTLMDERFALRALENVVNNALRYTPEGDEVRISAEVQADTCVVAIADNGPGMTAEELALIFEPFYRGTASRREPGSGLGLYVVKSITESFGWQLSVQAEPQSGACFTFRLPLCGTKPVAD